MIVQISNRLRYIFIVDLFSIHLEKQAVKKIIDGNRPTLPARKAGRKEALLKLIRSRRNRAAVRIHVEVDTARLALQICHCRLPFAW